MEIVGFVAKGIKDAYFIPDDYRIFLDENSIIAKPSAETVKIYCDSSTRKACVVIEGQEPTIISYPKPVTNNVGEYRAVIEATNIALLLKLKEVEILTDSQLVVNQVSGVWKCRKPHLLPFRDKVRDMLLASKAVLSWIPREENFAGVVLEQKRK